MGVLMQKYNLNQRLSACYECVQILCHPTSLAVLPSPFMVDRTAIEEYLQKGLRLVVLSSLGIAGGVLLLFDRFLAAVLPWTRFTAANGAVKLAATNPEAQIALFWAKWLPLEPATDGEIPEGVLTKAKLGINVMNYGFNRYYELHFE